MCRMLTPVLPCTAYCLAPIRVFYPDGRVTTHRMLTAISRCVRSLYEDDAEPVSEPLERLSISEPGRPQQLARPPPDADDDYAETDADYTYVSDSAGSPVYGQAKVV